MCVIVSYLFAAGSFETWGDMTASMNASGAINQHNATTIEQNNNLNKVRSDLQEKRKQTKTPETFLGANSSLVNLDELLGPTTAPSLAAIKPTQNRCEFVVDDKILSAVR